MLSVARHHRLWTSHSVERHRVWHDIIDVGQHTRLNDIGRGMTSPPLDSTHGRQCQAWHASSPLDSTHGRMTSGVACHHSLWAAHTVKRCWARHDITAFGQHTRSNDVGRGTTSTPLDNTHDRTTSGVTCHHRLWRSHSFERHRV